MDAFGTLIFQVAGQQLSVASARSILNRIVELFGGRLPTPAQVRAADPEDLRSTGLSRRKVQTLRAIAERFLDGTLSVETLSRLSDEEVEARLTAISGVVRGLRRDS